MQIYRIVIVGVLCSQILLASLDRAPYEVNTFTSLTEVHYVYRSAYNLISVVLALLPLPPPALLLPALLLLHLRQWQVKSDR